MKKINIVITSDPQYPWTNITDAGGSETEAERESRSEQLISAQYHNINDYAASSRNPTVVMINGDLTAFGHAGQLNKMKTLLGILKPPYRFGLGNHDIENNYNDTVFNQASHRMMEYMVDNFKYGRFNLPNESWDATISKGVNWDVFKGSFSYSWDEGEGFHFIQLQNFPGMTDYSFRNTGPGYQDVYNMVWDNNLTWLRADIASAVARGKLIFINVHKPNGWPADALNSIKSLLSQYKDSIKAIFAGHYHTSYGFKESYTNLLGGDVPVFLSGAASQQTYLIVESDDLNVNVYLVKNNDWHKRTLIKTIIHKDTLYNAVITSAMNIGKSLTIKDNKFLVLNENLEMITQYFTVDQNTSNDNYTIKTKKDFLYLDWKKNSSPSLQFSFPLLNANWNFEPQADGTYIISNVADSSMVIDVTGGKAINNAILDVSKRSNSLSQKFHISSVSRSSPVYIASGLTAGATKVLSATESNSSVILYTKDNGEKQCFTYVKCEDKGDNVYQIENIATGLILAWNASNGNELFLHRNEYKDEHYWRFERQTRGTYIISNYKNSALVVDVSNASIDNGTLIQLHARNGNVAQEFWLTPNSSTPALPENGRTFLLHPYLSNMTVKISSQNSEAILTNDNSKEHLQQFILVRCPKKGYNVFQIHSATWQDSVLGLFNGNSIYLSQNIVDDAQFWRFNKQGNGTYVISNLAQPALAWTVPVMIPPVKDRLILGNRTNDGSQQFTLEMLSL